LVSPNFAKLGLEFQYVPVTNIYLRTGTNVIGSSQHVPLGSDETSIISEFADSAFIGYGADITYKSFLGPIVAGIGGNSLDNNLRYYFSIGFSFNYSDR
jgi:NTE family protein